MGSAESRTFCQEQRPCAGESGAVSTRQTCAVELGRFPMRPAHIKKQLVVILAVLVMAACAAGAYAYLPVYFHRYLLATGEKSRAAGNLARAAQAFGQLTREDPKNMRAQFLVAQALRRLMPTPLPDLH